MWFFTPRGCGDGFETLLRWLPESVTGTGMRMIRRFRVVVIATGKHRSDAGALEGEAIYGTAI